MRKTVFLIFVSILIFVSCNNHIYHWDFEQNYINIREIKIVDATDEFNYIILKDIDISLIEELCKDIEKIEMRRYGTNLANPYNKCFLVVFNNQEYDIISQKESKHLKWKDGQLTAYNSWLECNKEQFNELMSKYYNL